MESRSRLRPTEPDPPFSHVLDFWWKIFVKSCSPFVSFVFIFPLFLAYGTWNWAGYVFSSSSWWDLIGFLEEGRRTGCFFLFFEAFPPVYWRRFLRISRNVSRRDAMMSLRSLFLSVVLFLLENSCRKCLVLPLCSSILLGKVFGRSSWAWSFSYT